MFDPEDTAAPGDTSSQDASKPGFQKAWNAWTSKPENNAALLQFGISMLQPRAPGQSGIGSIANAIGDAGGAAGRVQETQRAEELQAANIADKEAQRENQASLAASKNIEANAYDYAARNKQVVGGASGILRLQQDYRKWKNSGDANPNDPFAKSDAILGAVSKRFPQIRTKADLLADPQADAYAYKIFSRHGDSEAVGEEPTSGEGSSPAGAQPTPQGPRIIYDAKGQPFNWDGIQGHPPVPVKR